MGAGVQRDGHAGGGALVQGTVCQRPQQQPGQLTDVGHALNEFFWPKQETKDAFRLNTAAQKTDWLCIHHPLTQPSQRRPCGYAKYNFSSVCASLEVEAEACKLFKE